MTISSDLKQRAIAIVDGDVIKTERLDKEFVEIDKAGLWDYFADIVDVGRKFHNSNHLLCAYLWGICPEDPFEPGVYQGDLITVYSNEMPDLDIDLTPESRNPIKQFCVDTWGKDNVVSIVNFNCFGLKSGLRDMGRLFGRPSEVAKLSSQMDDDVNKMSWKDATQHCPALLEFQDTVDRARAPEAGLREQQRRTLEDVVDHFRTAIVQRSGQLAIRYSKT